MTIDEAMDGRWGVVINAGETGAEWSQVILVKAETADDARVFVQRRSIAGSWLRHFGGDEPIEVRRFPASVFVTPPKYFDFYLFENINTNGPAPNPIASGD